MARPIPCSTPTATTTDRRQHRQPELARTFAANFPQAAQVDQSHRDHENDRAQNTARQKLEFARQESSTPATVAPVTI